MKDRNVSRTEEATVARWNGGYGFLRVQAGLPDIFSHYSAIVSDEGYRQLTAGQRVTFHREMDDQGRERAADVRVIGGGVQ